MFQLISSKCVRPKNLYFSTLTPFSIEIFTILGVFSTILRVQITPILACFAPSGPFFSHRTTWIGPNQLRIHYLLSYNQLVKKHSLRDWWNWGNFSFHCFTVPVNAMASGKNFNSWGKFMGFLFSFRSRDRIFFPFNTINYGCCSIDSMKKNIGSWTDFSRYRASKLAGYPFFWSFLPFLPVLTIFCTIEILISTTVGINCMNTIVLVVLQLENTIWVLHWNFSSKN